MKFFTFILCLLSFISFSQDYNKVVLNLIKGINAPFIKVSEIKKKKDLSKLIFLDAREFSEFRVSHIKQAEFIGYKHFDLKKQVAKFKNKEVIVYCSVGYRSGKIVELFKRNGIRAYNLFGGIIAWKNAGLPLYDINNKETQTVHTYDLNWSKWLTNGEPVTAN